MWIKPVTAVVCAVSSVAALSSSAVAQNNRQSQLRAIAEGIVWGYMSSASTQGNVLNTYILNMYVLKNHSLGKSSLNKEFFFGILMGNQIWRSKNLGNSQSQVFNNVSSVVNSNQSVADETKKLETQLYRAQQWDGFLSTQSTWSTAASRLFR